jgi:hypothetical protein
MRTEAEVRSALEKRLGRPVSDALWQGLVEDRYVAEVLHGEAGAFDALVKQYRRRERWAREYQRESKTERREAPPDRRALLVSRLLAREASHLPEVKAFRREVLPGGLLSPEEVGPWIREKVREAGEGSPDRTLWWVEGGKWHSCFVGMEGVLARLWWLSREVARQINCSEAQATDFILTGRVPIISPLRWGVHRTFTQVYAYARIVLEINPEVSPAEVAQFYREARKSVLQGERSKPLSQRVAALVEFVLGHDGGTWREKMEAWNREYPQWRYTSEKNMARDYHRAVGKLLRPPKYEP